ncbi:MAG: serine hydrolase [Gemmatimonadaceae bacterium]|nr:serine hydrolase [Gemmatimonadaceae bacterium]
MTIRRSLLAIGSIALVTASCSRLSAGRPTATHAHVGPTTGSLVVVGGGNMGPEIFARFVALAGGPTAPIVVIPTAGEDSVYPAHWGGLNGLKAAGATRLTVLHTRDRRIAESDSFVAAIRTARGVWFPGGRQWRLVDSYLGTRTERELRAVLTRGGVIGGTSAGASILSSYLVRGARAGNTVMMAQGYEQGFGYLRDVAIDQHIVARTRQADLQAVITAHPALLGIGLDEGTALVVRGNHGQIIGRGKAFVHNGRDAHDPGFPYQTLLPGDEYDLAARRVTARAADDGPLNEAFVDSLFAEFNAPAAPGAAVLVAMDGKVLVSKGYGLADLDARVPVTPHTNFRLASVTKQFTAMATMLLVQDGRLRLEETLTDIFPDFPAYGSRITVRHLLTHTSGLRAYEDFVPDSQATQVLDADVLRHMAALDATYFPPGTRFRYSNSGYAVLAMIIEKRTGVRFAEFLKARIFDRVGMPWTLAREDGRAAVQRRAFGHSRRNGAWMRTDQSSTSAVLGDGGVYSSVAELYRWSNALETRELLGDSLRALLFKRGTRSDSLDVDYGFGWYLETKHALPRTRHTGSTIGFRNAIIRYPTLRATIIVLTNRNNANAAAIAEQIAARLTAVKHDPRWTLQQSGVTASFRGLSAVSGLVAWAGGSRGTVLRTINGGHTWENVSVPGADSLDFRDVHGVSSRVAYAMSAGPAEQGQARIYRTVDGGQKWTLQWSDTTKGIFLDGMAFWDSSRGIAFSDPVNGKPVILRTQNGTTWERVEPVHIPPALPGEGAFAASGTSVAVQGRNNAWIATGAGPEARVFRTTDAGRTWQVSSAGLAAGPSAGFFGIAFADARRGIAVAGDYTIPRSSGDVTMVTQDGGVTWRRASKWPSQGITGGVVAVRGAPKPLFAAVGAYGTAFSSDFGATWTHGDTLTLYAIDFATRDSGWAVGPRGRIVTFRGNTP